MSLKRTYLGAAMAALISCLPGSLFADSFTQTYNGTLATTSSVFQQSISLTSASDLAVNSTSYATGGFQPSLTLYTGAGAYLASQSASSSGAAPDPTTRFALDGRLTRSNLAAGSYILVLTNWLYQQPPTATNLSDGFVNYGGSTFTDVAGNLRTGAYAVTVAATPAGASAVPEPFTLGLLPLGLAAVYLLRKGSKSTVSDSNSNSSK